MPNRGTRLFPAIAVLLGLVAALLALELVFAVLPVSEPLERQPVDAANRYLHLRPNSDVVYSKGWDFAIRNRVRVNNFGFVNDQDYDPNATSPLLAVIGDSYVEALQVPYSETLHGRLARAAGTRGRVYSFGISGAPLSQYLAYAEYARDHFRPAAAVIVVISNDFDESLLEYTAHPGMHHLTPDPGRGYRLQLVPFQPTFWHRAIRSSALAQYLNSSVPGALQKMRILISEGEDGFVANTAADADVARIQKSRDAIDYFLRTLPDHAGLPPQSIAFVVDGTRTQLYDPRALERVQGSYFVRMRAYFLQQAREHGYHTVDMEPRFIARHARDNVRFEWDIDQHWNAVAHEEAARAVVQTGLPQRLFGPVVLE